MRAIEAIRRFSGGAAVAMALVGCASTQAVAPTRTSDDWPALNESVQAQLGAPLIVRGELTLYPGLELTNEVQWGGTGIDFLGMRFIVGPGLLVGLQQDENHIYYASSNLTGEDPLLGIQDFGGRGGLCVSKINPSEVRGYTAIGRCTHELETAPIYEETELLDATDGSFGQTLVYLGRRGDLVGLQYREVPADQTRERLTFEIVHDLNSGPTIALKGARIEIENAGPAQISYRLTSGFAPDHAERPVGEELISEIGEIVALRSNAIQQDALILSAEYRKDQLLNSFVMPAGVMPKIAETRSANFYYARNMMLYLRTRSEPAFGGLCAAKDNPAEINLWFNNPIFCMAINAPDGLPPVESTTMPMFGEDGFRQELVYAGRVGNVLRFLYRETFADPEKPNSSVELTHDLSTGNVFEHRGARIEIAEASNMGLRYRIATPFTGLSALD